MAVVISPNMIAKLTGKHGVKPEEVEQCFANRNGKYLEDLRPQHKTESGAPTYWFIGETHMGRRLKVTFCQEHGNLYLRSAYDANEATIKFYLSNGGGVI